MKITTLNIFLLRILLFISVFYHTDIIAVDVKAKQDASTTKTNAIELEIWNDPVFKKQFIASYGINSEIEPRIEPDELATLEKIRPLIAEDLPKAEETLKKKMKPECSAILDFTLGGIQFQQDKLEEALMNYQKAVGKFPSFRRAWRNLGLIQARQGKYDDAIKSFTRMIELGGGDAYSYGLLGFAYASKQDYQAAEAAYRNALLLQPDSTEWRLGITRCVFKQEKYEDAAKLLEVLIERFPEKTEFWLVQAQAFIGMKKPLIAAENLEAVDWMGKSTVESLNTLGNIYLSEGLVDRSADAYMRAITVNPDQPVTRPIQCAEMLAGRGSISQASAVVMKIKESWGDRFDEQEKRRLLKLEARISMAEGAGSNETASMLEEIVRLDPLDGESLLLLGQHYAKQNENDKAILYYQRAESIEAFEVRAKIRHAQVLVGMGRYAEAIPLLRRAQEIKPNDDVANYLKQIERLAKAH